MSGSGALDGGDVELLLVSPASELAVKTGSISGSALSTAGGGILGYRAEKCVSKICLASILCQSMIKTIHREETSIAHFLPTVIAWLNVLCALLFAKSSWPSAIVASCISSVAFLPARMRVSTGRVSPEKLQENFQCDEKRGATWLTLCSTHLGVSSPHHNTVFDDTYPQFESFLIQGNDTLVELVVWT